MDENSPILTVEDPSNTLFVNAEAHTSLQLLHRVSSDDEYDDDEDIIEADEIYDEHEEENGDVILIKELNNHNRTNQLTTPSKSLPEFSANFPIGRGRGLQSLIDQKSSISSLHSNEMTPLSTRNENTSKIEFVPQMYDGHCLLPTESTLNGHDKNQISTVNKF